MSVDITPNNYDSFMPGIASSGDQLIDAHDHLNGFNKHMRCDISDKISNVSTTDNSIIQTDYLVKDTNFRARRQTYLKGKSSWQRHQM